MEQLTPTEEKVRQFIVKNLMLKTGGSTLSPDQALLESGIMTSFGIVEMVTYLEQTFGVSIDDHEVVPENFHSVRTIARLVEQKRK